MPDPTPLSRLAGIEQMLRDIEREYAENAVEWGALTATMPEVVASLRQRHSNVTSAADYLAGLGKVLEEWRAARKARREAQAVTPRWRTMCDAFERERRAEEALYTYLSTPTSPREPRGKEKE